MDGTLLVTGLVKLALGALVAVGAIALAFRGLARLLGTGRHETHAKDGGERGSPEPGVEGGAVSLEVRPPNPATGTLQASSLLAMGLLVRHALAATFDAIDLALAATKLDLALLGRLTLYALGHLGLSLTVGVAVLALGVRLFNAMTPGIDELDEVRRGALGPALVLGAILVVTALLTGAGLSEVLSALLPLPELPRGLFLSPS